MSRTEITPIAAVEHETLVVQADALLRQLEIFGRKRPDAAPSDESLVLAHLLMLRTRRLVGPAASALRLPLAKTVAGLAVQLGHARALLAGYEAQRSAWDTGLNAFVWRLSRGDRLPIARLRPALTKILQTPEQQRHADQMRNQLTHLIDAKFSEGYQQGYAEAKEGLPATDVSRTHADRIKEMYPAPKNAPKNASGK